LGDRDGNLWATADGEGLCRLNAMGFECAREVEGLTHDVVRSMFEDREGNLWIGATTTGLHRISDSKLATAFGPLDSNSVRALAQDRAGTIWAGTDGAGLGRIVRGVLQPYEYNDRLGSPFIRALHGDADGVLWVGTIVGLDRIDTDGAVTGYDKADGLPGAIVFALAPDGAGGLWIGTSTGLARLSNGSVSALPSAGTHDIRSLHRDRSGRLWIGQRSGLQCLHDDRIDDCGAATSFVNTSIFAFHEDADGALWIGTSKGLARMRDGALVRYTEAQGLADDVVFTLLDDGAGNFWTSSNRGIARTPKADFDALDRGMIPRLRPRTFDKSDGMRASQANGASQSPGLRARDGRIWIATVRGAVSVDLPRIRENTLAPLVAVERVVVDDRQHGSTAIGRLGPGVDKLEFHYAAMSYVAPEAVRYRYRLEGYDRGWVEAGARRTAYYTNLRPGDYAFLVSAANNDGVWNEQGARVAFSIVPHYYESDWFRALLVLLAVVALGVAYRMRVRRLRVRERELTRLVEVRTDALREANAALMRMASLDGLTRIANRTTFDAALAEAWDAHAARGVPLSLLLCDIDEFKAYNDTYGHPAGDAALIRVAETIQSHARGARDLAARYGGEEFVVVLARPHDEALATAGQLLDAIRALGIPHGTSRVATCVTLSIGVASCVPGEPLAPEQLVEAADRALYSAKRAGRDRVASAPPLAIPA
ncbi:MAG TPA: diguanylate cyclase, partial [Candidatus Saccharimonadia bacterium]|nr:diguanylate cyclase [Candidatus Saccharimonadia bacterium]